MINKNNVNISSVRASEINIFIPSDGSIKYIAFIKANRHCVTKCQTYPLADNFATNALYYRSLWHVAKDLWSAMATEAYLL